MSAKTILIVAPHPDDETLGAGGTLLKHRKNSDNVFWLILTQADESPLFTEKFRKKRAVEIQKVATLYSFQKTFQLPFAPTRLDTYPQGDLVSSVSKVVEEVRPDIVYVPNRGDIHSDHRVAFEVMMSCTKSFRYPFIQRVLMYETPSETDVVPPSKEEAFIPNVFVDIKDFFEKKIEIMSVYESEFGNHPFPRSQTTLKALAEYRGSLANMEKAEAFCLLRDRC